MEKVTSKSTKDVIYNAYKEAMEKIAKMEQEKFDPVAEKERLGRRKCSNLQMKSLKVVF